MRSAILFAFILAFAGRALALNIVIGGSVGNVSATDFLAVQDTKLNADCQSQCQPATQAIQACNDDDACLCDTATVAAVVACQQCMFTDIIHDNRKMPDPRAGSAPALSAYAAACLASPANVTVPATSLALTLPSNWDGPSALPLNLGETIVAVAAGAVLGVGSIVILCTM
ncbi:hypothetical protein BV25DRAFT_1915228 [Artomyces pyxidatus]|uniref:Uncharacterized protein n=1 Tax=Artomyces pyxidatus TaxID=48021 RepID=A0ACB8T3K8_9AGAM|nr:hypothetical protein BV25DRAFT_1915228 [Artomyces pyxidatus]